MYIYDSEIMLKVVFVNNNLYGIIHAFNSVAKKNNKNKSSIKYKQIQDESCYQL